MDGDEVQQLRVTTHEGGDRFIGHLRRAGLSEHSLQLVGGALVREVGVGTAGGSGTRPGVSPSPRRASVGR